MGLCAQITFNSNFAYFVPGLVWLAVVAIVYAGGLGRLNAVDRKESLGWLRYWIDILSLLTFFASIFGYVLCGFSVPFAAFCGFGTVLLAYCLDNCLKSWAPGKRLSWIVSVVSVVLSVSICVGRSEVAFALERMLHWLFA
ncbi:MAG: hypothetical protein V1754_06960 [Pseudomonadota bacterium]